MIRTTFVATVMLVVCALPVLAQPFCGPSSIRGTWAYTYQGVVYPFMPDGSLSPVALPIVLIGVAAVDSQGRLTGAGTGIMGEQTIEYEFVNSRIELGPGCTATATWSLSVGGVTLPGEGIDRLVLIPPSGEIRATSVQGIFGKPVYLGTWKRIEPHPTPVTW